MRWAQFNGWFFALLAVLALGASCQFSQRKLSLKEEAANAMIGLQALQYQDFRFWYHKIEKRAIVDREGEATATLYLLQAAEKLIYWKEQVRETDSLLNLALSNTNDDSLTAAIQLRRADYLITTHQYSEALKLLSKSEYLLPANLESEKSYLMFRANAINYSTLELNWVIDSLRSAQVSKDVLLKFLTKSGDISYNKGHYDWAANYYSDALSIAQNIGWDGFQARLLIEMADVCFIQDQLDSVGYYVEKANKILVSMPGSETVCNGFYLAARAQLKLGESEMASNNFQELLSIASGINSSRNMLKAYLGLSEVALQAQQYKLADSLVQKAIQLTEPANDDVLTHQAYFLASKVASALGYIPKAIAFLEQAEKLERLNQDTTELIVTLNEKIRLLLNTGSMQSLALLFKEQENLLKAFPNNDAWLSLYKLKADWLANLGDFKEAILVTDEYERFQNKLNVIDGDKIKRINELQKNVIKREAQLKNQEDGLFEVKFKLILVIGIASLLMVVVAIIAYIQIRKISFKLKKVKADLKNIESDKIKVESDYIQLKKITDEYLKYKKLEFELFESWSKLPDRKGISVTRFNAILFYHLRNSLNYLKKSLNIDSDKDGLSSSKERFQPILFKPEWEASWSSLKIFHPCLVEVYLFDSFEWKGDSSKLKILIDILVRQFMAKSHDRKELSVRLDKNGFALETSLLYEHDLVELLYEGDILEPCFSNTSIELQKRISKIAIIELIKELPLKAQFEKDLDTARIKFEFNA